MDAMKSKTADKARKIVDEFLDLINSCDKDSLFHNEMEIEGSVKTDLKVDHPDEFDFSWKLMLTRYRLSRYGEALINEACRNHNHRNGSACLDDPEWENSRVKISKDNISLYCLHSTMDDFETVSTGECIPPRAISEYLHKCVTEAAELSNSEVSVRDRVYGPAIRFTIKDRRIEHKINVDITARVDVSFSRLQERSQEAIKERIADFPSVIQRYVCKNGNVEAPRPLYLVPKSDGGWVLSFANYENSIINQFGQNKKNKYKQVMRQTKLKLNGWKKRKSNGKAKLVHVSSYLLKTIFLQKIVEKPNVNQWSKTRIDRNAEEMLRQLCDSVEKGELPAFFDQDTNLLENVSSRSRRNLIQFIKEDIETESDSEETDDD